MKRRQIVITWVITVLFLLFTSWYGIILLWSASRGDEIPGFLRWGLLAIVLLLIAPLMALMIITAVSRKKEIEKGEEDDLGEY